MLKDAIKPTEADLRPLVDEALDNGNKSPSEFLEDYLPSLVLTLKQKPKTYAAYGQWWWSLKKILIENGYRDFGITIEAITPEIFSYDDPVLTCCAAWAYHNDNLVTGNIYNAHHVVPLTDSNTYDYYLTDMDMVAVIAG